MCIRHNHHNTSFNACMLYALFLKYLNIMMLVYKFICIVKFYRSNFRFLFILAFKKIVNFTHVINNFFENYCINSHPTSLALQLFM